MGALTARAALIVRPGPAVRVLVAPATATITTAQTQQYTVTCWDALGNNWVATVPDSDWIHSGAGGFSSGDQTYTPAAADAGSTVSIRCQVDGTASNTASLKVTGPSGAGPVLAWDKDTRAFYLCANPADPQTGLPVPATGSYDIGGQQVDVTVKAYGSYDMMASITNVSASGPNSLRVRFSTRSGAVMRAYEYSTIGSVTKTASFYGSSTYVDGAYRPGFWGLTHTVSGYSTPPPMWSTVTYGSAQQP